MSEFHDGPRIYSLSVHGIKQIELEHDPARQCISIKLTGEAERRDFTVTVYTDAPDSVPIVVTTYATHELEKQSA
jgi:hypothetical protein